MTGAVNCQKLPHVISRTPCFDSVPCDVQYLRAMRSTTCNVKYQVQCVGDALCCYKLFTRAVVLWFFVNAHSVEHDAKCA